MRSKILATVITLAALVAIPVTAFAEPSGNLGAQRTEEKAKGDKGDKPVFPMPAAQYKAKMDGRLTKARAHMEKRAAKLSADDAKQLRAKFDAGAAQVNQEVAKATADGTVTKDEAHKVREVAKSVTGHHGKHARNRKAPKKA